MSKREILDELPKLAPDDRQQILERLCELQEKDLVDGVQPTPSERALLDGELREFRQNPQAGASWEEVEARILKRPRE